MAQFSPDGRYILTLHKPPKAADKLECSFTVWDAATGRKLWDKQAEQWWDGFTPDGNGVVFFVPIKSPADKRQVREALALATGQPVPPPPAGAEWLWPLPPPSGAVAKAAENRIEVRDAQTNFLLGVLPAAGGPTGLYTGRLRQWVGGGGDFIIPWTTPTDAWYPSFGVVSTYRPPRAEVIHLPERKKNYLDRFQAVTTPGGVKFERVEPLTAEDGSRGGDTVAVESFDPISGKTELLKLRSPAFAQALGDFEIRYETSVGRTVIVVPLNTIEDVPADPKESNEKVRYAERLVVFDRATGRERFTTTISEVLLPQNSPIPRLGSPLAVSPDCTRIVVLDPKKKRMLGLNAETGNEAWSVPLPVDGPLPGRVLFLPDSSRVMWLKDGALRVFDAADGRLVNEVVIGSKPGKNPDGTDADDTGRVELTPDGRTLFYIEGRVLTLIDTADWTTRHRLGTPQPPTARGSREPRWDSVGDRFAVFVSEVESEVWDVHTGRRVSRFELTPPRAQPGAFPSPGTLFVAQAVYSADATRAFLLVGDSVRVIDLPRGREVLALPLGDSDPGQWRMTLSGDGNELTAFGLRNYSRVAVKRVFDARPVTDEELARGKRLDAIRPLPPKPAAPPATASEFFDAAILLEPRGQGKEAVAAYREAIKLDGDFAPLHRRLAWVYQSSALDLDAALAEYREAVRLAPGDLGSWYQIGTLLEGRGDHRAAVKALRKTVEADTRPLFDAMTVRGGRVPVPTRWEILNALGYSLREAGRLAEAEREFREALRLADGMKDPQSTFEGRPNVAKVSLNLMVCLFRQGEPKDAGAEADALVGRLTRVADGDQAKGLPRYPHPLAQGLTDIAETFLWADQYAEAVAWADRAIKAWAELPPNPNLPKGQGQAQGAYWVRAVALNWLDRGPEAIEAINESIKLTRDLDKPYQRMMRARYVAKAGDHRAAAKQVKELLAEPNPAPNNWDAALALSLCVKAAKGDEKLQEEYAARAVELLKKVLEAKQYGYPWKKDPDLNPIRDRADFKALLAEWEERTAAPPEKK